MSHDSPITLVATTVVCFSWVSGVSWRLADRGWHTPVAAGRLGVCSRWSLAETPEPSSSDSHPSPGTSGLGQAWTSHVDDRSSSEWVETRKASGGQEPKERHGHIYLFYWPILSRGEEKHTLPLGKISEVTGEGQGYKKGEGWRPSMQLIEYIDYRHCCLY